MYVYKCLYINSDILDLNTLLDDLMFESFMFLLTAICSYAQLAKS